MTPTIKAFYVRFQIPISTREAAPQEIDIFMNAFVQFLEGLGIGPTGDMSPAGSGVFLILGIDPTVASVIVDVKDTDPPAVDAWLREKGTSYEVGPVQDVEIDSKAQQPRKGTP
ncbi:MAG: hypothetical protein ACRD1X_05580 [Vicinamibacteria bacterium]